MLDVVQIPKESLTGEFLQNLHSSIFEHPIPSDYFRYDLCLAVENKDKALVGYALARELSSQTIELAWGGTSKDHRGFASKEALQKISDKCLEFYLNVTFQTWHQNTKMIKLGIATGFIITGTKLTDTDELMVIFNKRRKQ